MYEYIVIYIILYMHSHKVPESLVNVEQVDALVAKAQPSIVSRQVDAIGPDEGKLVRLTLSNGE